MRNPAGAAIDELVIDSNFSRVDVDTGAPLDLQRLRLVAGSFNGRAPVTIADNVEWSSGFFINAQPTTVAGNWQLLPGTRVFRANVSNSGSVAWTGGNFSEWSGRLTVQPGKQFDIAGDFNSAGGVGGRLVNAGTLTKSAGTGRSQLAMGVDNLGGTVRALSGTLALTGGGTHTDATFAASAGAVIELAGGTTFSGQITPSGRLNVTGGDFTLLSGTSYLHAPGNRFEVANVRVNPGAHLSVVDTVSATGNVVNFGTFTPSSHVSIFGDFMQQGSFVLNPGKELFVAGIFDNHRVLTVSDGGLRAGSLINRSTINVVGSSNFDANTLDNRGTLVLGPANGFPGTRARIGGVGNSTNSGSLRVDGSNVGVQSQNLQNLGVISNEGQWEANGNFSQTGAGRFNNAGSLSLNASAGLFDTASIVNSGSITVQGGVLDINMGTQLSGPGSFLQEAGVTRVNGRLQAGGGITIDGGVLKGTGTVEGYVSVGAAGQWQPGNSAGTMTVLGDADLRGALEIEIATSTVHDRLVIRDTFTARSGAAISFVIDPGYIPREPDSDRIAWLSATGANFEGGVNLSFSGAPNQWSVSLSTDGRQLVLNNDLAVQIPLSGTIAIPATAVQFNALGSSSGGYPLLARLDNAGFFHNRVGAIALVLGVMNNEAGATLVNRGDMFAGTLNNIGSFQNRPGSTFGVRTLNNSGHLVNQGAAQIYGDFTNAAGAVFEQRGEMQINQRVTNDGRLVVAGRLSGPYGYNGNGDVLIEAGGSFEVSESGYFWASAGHVRVDGLLAASDIRFFGNSNRGSLSGTGRLQGNVESFADIEPGNSVGQLTVDGNLNSRGSLNLEIESANVFDRLVVTGNASVSSFIMYLLGSYRPVLGESFSFLSVAGTLQMGNPLNWAVMRLVGEDPASGWTLWASAEAIYDANVPADWRAQFNGGTLSITAIPEPGTWALWLAGLVAVARIARRRGVGAGPAAAAATGRA